MKRFICGRKGEVNMELRDLSGEHLFSGVDYIPSTSAKDEWDDFGNDILFCIDGVNYIMTEDQADGYRSYMTELEITNREIKNVFPGQKVRCEFVDKVSDDYWSESANILQIYSSDNKLILEVGTKNTDDYYPYTVFEWRPENMEINKDVYFK
jgi:hypothetical protein